LVFKLAANKGHGVGFWTGNCGLDKLPMPLPALDPTEAKAARADGQALVDLMNWCNASGKKNTIDKVVYKGPEFTLCSVTSLGYSRCRLCRCANGDEEYTLTWKDGSSREPLTWPSGVAHYMLDHGVPIGATTRLREAIALGRRVGRSE
jgi:hypothetical protein